MIKKIVWCIGISIVLGLSFSSVVFAEDGPWGASMPNNIQGNSSIQPQSTPEDVAKQAAQKQQQALTQQEQARKEAEYKACMENTKDDAYCTCLKNGWIKLNTNVPFVGKCINKDNSSAAGSTTSTAFTDLIGGLSQIVVTAILIVSFMFIIIGGVQRASGNPAEGKKKILKVVIGLAILWSSWVILRLINPNFFK